MQEYGVGYKQKFQSTTGVLSTIKLTSTQQHPINQNQYIAETCRGANIKVTEQCAIETTSTDNSTQSEQQLTKTQYATNPTNTKLQGVQQNRTRHNKLRNQAKNYTLQWYQQI